MHIEKSARKIAWLRTIWQPLRTQSHSQKRNSTGNRRRTYVINIIGGEWNFATRREKSTDAASAACVRVFRNKKITTRRFAYDNVALGVFECCAYTGGAAVSISIFRRTARFRGTMWRDYRDFAIKNTRARLFRSFCAALSGADAVLLPLGL